MDSKQSIPEPIPAEFNSSIGPVKVEVGSGDSFSIGTVSEDYPKISLYISPDDDDHWKLNPKPLYFAPDMEEAAPPQGLVKELFELGIKWADSHPEEFERAAARDFDESIVHSTHYLLGQVLEALKESEDDLAELLSGDDAFGEFAAQAPPELREVVQNAAKTFHAMGLQAAATGDAIREAATAFTGRRIVRPGDLGV